MKYSEIIHHIQTTAAASDGGSQDAIELVVENVAAYLPPQMRYRFAAGLPPELQSAAQMLPAVKSEDEGIVEQLMHQDRVDKISAQQRIRAAWQALYPAFDTHEVVEFKAQLPRNIVVALE
jgi:uncharacterized protein (DUF2267 family)